MRSRLLEVWLLTSTKSSSKHISTANCDSSLVLTAFAEALLPKLQLMFSRLFRHGEMIIMLSSKKTRLLLSTTEWLYTLEVLRDEIGNSVHSRNLPVQRNIREERPGIGEGMGWLPFILGLVHTKEAGNWSQMVLETCLNMIRIMVIHRTMLCRPRSTFFDSLARNFGMRLILQNSLIRVFANRTSI